jgi:flagella basal body P-ring formation protein FlgA
VLEQAEIWIPATSAGMTGALWATVVAIIAWLLTASPILAAELELPVPKVTIYPGEVIGEDQLVGRAFIARTVARATVHEAREALIGKVARRTLLPGQPIPVSGIRDPYLVTQGKNALAVLEAGGLTITLNAMVLQSGSIGDVVSLRNIDSGTIIKGTVAPDGTVRLAAP